MSSSNFNVKTLRAQRQSLRVARLVRARHIKGQTLLRAEDFYDEDLREIEIPLKPNLSPQQNAARFYKDYARAKHAEQVLTQQIAQGEIEEAYLGGVLEELARAEKTVGKPLDAKVTLYVGEDAKAAWESVKGANLAELCIVSELEVSETPVEGWAGESVQGLTVKVEASTLPKCPRCWTHSAGIGTDEKHPELCPRCAKAVG